MGKFIQKFIDNFWDLRTVGILISDYFYKSDGAGLGDNTDSILKTDLGKIGIENGLVIQFPIIGNNSTKF
jgi:hypothetical protein